MTRLTLNTPINQVFMIGPTYAKRLEKLNIFSAHDLLHHYPFRYNDLSLITTINQLKIGETVTVQGQIISCQNLLTKFGKKLAKAVLKDQTGSIEAIWFNQTYISKTLLPGLTVNLSGTVGWFNRKLTLTSPEFEIIKDNQPAVHTARLVPVYPETAGVSSKWLRSRIKFLLEKLEIEIKQDWLPNKIKKTHQLIELDQALRSIHFPKDKLELKKAHFRLSFNEMFLLQLEALERKKLWKEKKLSHQLKVDQEKVLQLISSLPFKLTNAQNLNIKQILTDLGKGQPMNRLLQGDVGSGKTVVAAVAVYVSFLNGFKSILMAPTQILADQHFATLKTVFGHTDINLSLITGATKEKNLKKDLLVGTHALLHQKLDLNQFGLIIIDEQHRFGVKQRSQLITNSKLTPHLLSLTATPIPRTVALTVYADLDLSVLDEMPLGRKAIKTWVVPPQKRLSAYHWIDKQINLNKSQTFIVCPLIESSDHETLKDIKNVTQEFDQLKSIFPQKKLGLLHGKLKVKDKQKVIEKFKSNKIDLLVSTPVIEVGIDIPNATIMLIEDADRFGLAQLHQLRGRIGRGEKQSYCLLFSQSKNPQTLERLKYLETLNSGFRLAEIDLKLRGPGDIYGLKQHGFLDLKLASFSDSKLLSSTRSSAQNISKKLTSPLKKMLKARKIHQIAPN